MDPVRDTHRRCIEILDELEKVVVGKREVLEEVLAAILSGGHVLFDDYPGVAKTLIARSLATVLGLEFSRIQFTPDLLPSDVTGSYLYDQRRAAFEFRKGPLFANLVLGDEINRAPPKTQAALLEAMQESQVTVEDSTHTLAPPFLVIATQNPIEFEGTYPLPEAQLDRFMVNLRIGYPSHEQQWEIFARRLERGEDDVKLASLGDGPALLEMQSSLEAVEVARSVGDYIINLVEATRSHGDVQVGASPRAAMALMKLARARALLRERDFVIPEDVKACAVPCLSHRITLRPEVWVRRVTGRDVVESILGEIATPQPEAQ
ncbi:MAG: MoxR family ATPase [Actinomycetota bacterium]|nr:MoxR family ATPase [Actinomycetota bacterium]